MRFQRLFLTTLLLLATCSFAQAEEFEFQHEFVLGTSMELKVNATSRELAQQAETLALVELDRLTAVFSHYDPSSEFSRFLELRPGATTEVSRELFEALRVCQEWMKVSEGSFHPAVERLTRQWQEAEQRNTLPASPSLEKAVREINQPHWRLANDSHQVTRSSQVPLSLNAIAKGIVLDRVVESVLDSIPVQGIMLNIGGDVRVAGQIKVDVAIADPNADTISSPAFTHICLTDGAIATSGTSVRFFAIDGKRYSHILDPRTGLPVSEVVSSTVIADCASTADVVATICSVLPIHQSLALVNALPGVDCRLISSTGLVAFSENFPQDENGDGETTEKQEASPSDCWVLPNSPRNAWRIATSRLLAAGRLRERLVLSSYRSDPGDKQERHPGFERSNTTALTRYRWTTQIANGVTTSAADLQTFLIASWRAKRRLFGDRTGCGTPPPNNPDSGSRRGR